MLYAVSNVGVAMTCKGADIQVLEQVNLDLWVS